MLPQPVARRVQAQAGRRVAGGWRAPDAACLCPAGGSMPSPEPFLKSSPDALGCEGCASAPTSVLFWPFRELLLSLLEAYRPQQGQSWVSKGQTLDHSCPVGLWPRCVKSPRGQAPCPKSSFLGLPSPNQLGGRGVGGITRSRVWASRQGPARNLSTGERRSSPLQMTREEGEAGSVLASEARQDIGMVPTRRVGSDVTWISSASASWSLSRA